MLEEKFEILLAPTCTGKQLGRIEVWANVYADDDLYFVPYHCIKTTYKKITSQTVLTSNANGPPLARPLSSMKVS